MILRKSTTGFLVSVFVFAITFGCGKTNGNREIDFSKPPGLAEVANAKISGIGDHVVTLRDGLWEGSPYVEGGASRPKVGLVDHFILHGDLNGDEIDDSVVLLSESSGGSGSRTYLAVMSRDGRRVANLGTVMVGDRIQVISGWVAERQVVLDLVRAGPGDAACCPSERAVVSWDLVDDGLKTATEHVIGTLSLSDLEGPEWTLIELGRGRTIPDGVTTTLVFQADKVAGSGGCNRYFGSVSSTTPGTLEFSAMGTTQMACPDPAMGVERQYLRSLAKASHYGFSGGLLFLNCDTDNGTVTLLFDRPRPAAATENDHP